MYIEQGKMLRDIREKFGYSLDVASKKMDITTNYLSLIERGKRKPSKKVQQKISSVYKLKDDEMFKLYGDIKSNNLEKIISSTSLIDILSSISSDINFTESEKNELSQAIQEEVFKIIKKRGDNE
ncbi:helix-turn-helix domain-containing protein [Clostridium perfringens]